MFKDPDKQREANKQAMKRYREAEQRRKGITENSDTVIPKAEGITVTLATAEETKSFTAKPKPHKLNRMANIINEQVLGKPKRGKDIKTFADLPPDVQQSIDMLS